MQDEKSWRQQYADIPNNSVTSKIVSLQSDAKKSDPLDLSEFSQLQLDGGSNFSMGQFFDNRNEKLCEMLPNKSPTKAHKPRPLFDETSTVAEDRTFEKSPPVRDSAAHQDSIMSVSTIAAHMCKYRLNFEHACKPFYQIAFYS